MPKFTVTQAAAILNTNERNVRRWCASGHLPAERFGGHSWMIDEADLEGFERPRRGRPSGNKQQAAQEAAERIE